jgi:hypothetical protein
MAEGSEFESRLSQKFSSFSVVQTGSEAHPAPCPRVKWPGREADNSPPTGDEVKNTRIYTSTPLYVFMVYSLIN